MFAFLFACAAPESLDLPLDFEGEVVATWEDQETRRQVGLEDPRELDFWGLPGDTDIDLWLDGEFYGTWTTEPVDTTGLVPLEVTHRAEDAEVDDVRFVSVMKVPDTAVAVMHDTRGRAVWRQDLDTSELVKGVAVDPEAQRVYALLPSDTLDEGARIRVAGPTGGLETLAADCALHHGLALGPEGDLLGLGWEIEPIGDELVLFDTLEHVDVETGACTTLLRTQDHLPWPTEEEVRHFPPGLYDGDVRAYGYANGLSFDPTSELVSISVPMVSAGLLVTDLEGEATFLTDDDELYDEPHYGWANEQGEVLVYNRRSDEQGSTVEALTLEGERVGRYHLQQPTGEPAYNSHLGTVFPVDRELGVEGGLLAGYHPFADSTYELTEDPFDPSGTRGASRRLLQLQSADPSTNAIGGFMEAYSLEALNR